jgi:hypothetical protein
VARIASTGRDNGRQAGAHPWANEKTGSGRGDGPTSNTLQEERLMPRLANVIGAALLGAALAGTVSARPAAAADPEYRLLATNKTSTMQKELSAAASGGFRFAGVMGGETAFGGSETVVVMSRSPEGSRFEYRLLATNKTSTMQKELQQASDEGFEYRGQTVFDTAFGGREVVVILERDARVEAKPRFEYRLLATKKTSTMQSELLDAAGQGFEFVGLTVGQTAFGGSEVVTIMRRPLR